MEYEEAIAYIESFDQGKIDLRLERIQNFLKILKNPQNGFKSIKIGGTNGKGSTATYIHSILASSQIQTGLFTSPHIQDYCERIKLNSKCISEKDFARIIAFLRQTVEANNIETSFFELMTVAAFVYFSEKNVQIAVLEIGLGGRLDATNTAEAVISVITNIELDHTKTLGGTYEKIASEKVGILNENSTLITAEGKPNVLELFQRKCEEKNCAMLVLRKDFRYSPLKQRIEEQEFNFFLGKKIFSRLKIKMVGSHQFENASLALAAVEILNNKGFKIGDESVRLGLLNAKIPGRFEKVLDRPLTILDSSHNPAGCLALSRTVKQLLRGKNITLVFGCSNDKKYDEMLSILLPLAHRAVFTKAHYRPRDPKDLLDYAIKKKPQMEVNVFPHVQKAVSEAIHSVPSDSVVLVCGSIFVVGEAYPFFVQKNGKAF